MTKKEREKVVSFLYAGKNWKQIKRMTGLSDELCKKAENLIKRISK